MKNIAQIEERKQPKIETEMNGKRLTVRAGLLLFIGRSQDFLSHSQLPLHLSKTRGKFETGIKDAISRRNCLILSAHSNYERIYAE